MPEISRFLGIVIAMYYRDHPPPHFHARYGAQVAVLDIETLAVVKGRLPPRVLGLVVEWAVAHRGALRRNWELARATAPLEPVPPLE